MTYLNDAFRYARPEDVSLLIYFGVISLLMCLVLASHLVAVRRNNRRRLEGRRALSMALTNIDRARGLDLEKTVGLARGRHIR